MTANSFGSRATLEAGGATHEIYRLDAVPGSETLPYSLKVLLENLLRNEDGKNITKEHITALANWDKDAQPDTEIQFTPARVILQDLTGVPAVVDLAAMREAMQTLGGDAKKINPLIPAELVIDHSVVADVFGSPDAFEKNVALEFQRNRERFQFLRWGQNAFDGFRVVPPGTGIVHQVNIEHLARVVMTNPQHQAYPDTCVGTDSHTTMENGLGILGWGVGGIEAEAAMLGQPISMLIPRVVGFRLTGAAARRHHRHRPGPDDHPDAAQARRGRQVRRVLRRRRGQGPGREPGHDREHVARVRLHLRDLPDRRGDDRVPHADRPNRPRARPGREVRQGAGPVARPEPGAAVLRAAHPRPRHGRAEHRRPQAPAGQDRPEPRQDRLQGRPARPTPAATATAASPPPTPASRRTSGPPTRSRSPSTTAARPPSTTATSSSPRSPPAPTPPTRS